MGEASSNRVCVLGETELFTAASTHIATAIRSAVAARGRCDLALAGGSTPKRAYELLARHELPWAALHCWFGDERCVPHDHPDSNYAMARAALFDRVALPAANVHRVEAECPDREQTARAYDAALPARLDLLVLGVGPDGHTASLFPGSPALLETKRRVVAVVGSKPPPHRLTITPLVIAAARSVLVLASGAEKAAAIRRALSDPEVSPSECPARLLRDANWLLDRAAAAEIATTSWRNA